MKFAREWSDKLWHSPTSQRDVVLLHCLPMWIWMTWKGHCFSPSFLPFFNCLTAHFLWHTWVWTSTTGPNLKCSYISRQKLFFLIFFCTQLFPECPRYQMYWNKILLVLLLPVSVMNHDTFLRPTRTPLQLHSFICHVINLTLTLIFVLNLNP